MVKTNNLLSQRTNELIVKPQLTDSTLSLYSYISLLEKQQWRKQKVQVIVYLPKNQKYEEFYTLMIQTAIENKKIEEHEYSVSYYCSGDATKEVIIFLHAAFVDHRCFTQSN
jgi:hypothetical protein